MRSFVCVLAAASGFAVTGFAAHPALAQGDRAGAAFWKSVQANCNAAHSGLRHRFGRVPSISTSGNSRRSLSRCAFRCKSASVSGLGPANQSATRSRASVAK